MPCFVGGVSSAAAPTDRQVVDFEQEEETRKLETNKWLEHHFGSKSTLSSRDSAFDFDDEPVKTSPPVNGTVIRNGIHIIILYIIFNIE